MTAERRNLVKQLIKALQAGLDAEEDAPGDPDEFWDGVQSNFPAPVEMDDGDLVSPLAMLAVDLGIRAEIDKGSRPGTAAANLVGHIVMTSLPTGVINEISAIEAGQVHAHKMLGPILSQPLPPVLIKALINRLTLALARRTGSVDHALLFLMTTIDRSSHLDDEPPLPPAGLTC